MNFLPETFKYTVPLNGIELAQAIRIFRAMGEKYQAEVVGITGGFIGLRCKDEKKYNEWVKAWEVFV